MIIGKTAQVVDCWQFRHVDASVDYVFHSKFGRPGYLLHNIDGRHMITSKHYEALGWDIRVWIDPFDATKGRLSNETCEEIAVFLRLVLGTFYDVVVHYSKDKICTHIHIEYDPR